MKLHHFALVFMLISIVIIVITDIESNNLKAVIENRKQIDRCLDIAIDDGVTSLVEVDESNHIVINKEAAINSFFMSLNSAFGVLSDEDNQEKLNLYVPVISVTMEDGFYVFYSDEFTANDEFTYVSKRWSEKFPYFYEDDDFVYRFTLGDIVSIYDKNNLLGGESDQQVYCLDYHDFQTKAEFTDFRNLRSESFLLSNESFELLRKGIIINCIEDSMAYYTSRHNKIASQYGITYNFSLPAIHDNEWAPFIDDVNMFVIFQGYPYGDGAGETYNRIASAGAKVTKNEVYYIEQKDWYFVYHRDTCPELLKSEIILRSEQYYDPLMCVKEGCYQCPVCNGGNGVYAPEYIPSNDGN